MATTSLRPPQRSVFSDAVSLRSFHVKAMPSGPPSLKSPSLRARTTFALSNLLGSIRRVSLETPKANQPARFQDITKEVEVEKEKSLDIMGSPLSEPQNNPSNLAKTSNSGNKPIESATPPTATPPARTKSRLVRLLTTKKNAAATPPSSSATPPVSRPNKRPPAVNNAFSKEQREAALRERGLLPPLIQKDHSQQERELDNRIPIAQPIQEERSSADDNGTAMSAADLIKKEWESKNKEAAAVQRQRLNQFKFGGSSPPLPASPLDAQSPSPSKTELENRSATEDEPRPKHQASLSQPMVSEASKGHKPSLSLQHKALPLPPSAEEKRPTTPLTPILDLPYGPEFAEYLFPLPPSPLKKQTHISTSSSGHLSTSSVHDKPDSIASAASASGARTPIPQIDTRATSVTPTPPVLSLTSPVSATLSTHPSATSGTLVTSPVSSHTRADLSPLAESSSSIFTPSLDSASQTISTMNTADSLRINGKVKVAGLKVKTVENGKGIPVIIESPAEDGISEGVVADHVGSDEQISVFDHDDEAPPPPVPRDKAPKRGMTHPTSAKPDTIEEPPLPVRRKTINPFKRNQSPDGTKRSMASSFVGLSRSVVGTLSRPKQNPDTSSKGFDASNLPPSPTLPSHRSQSPQRQFRQKQSPPPAFVRQPVAPMLYSHGSILAEASNIEDEEQRRMTELAFLG